MTCKHRFSLLFELLISFYSNFWFFDFANLQSLFFRHFELASTPFAFVEIETLRIVSFFWFFYFPHLQNLFFKHFGLQKYVFVFLNLKCLFFRHFKLDHLPLAFVNFNFPYNPTFCIAKKSFLFLLILHTLFFRYVYIDLLIFQTFDNY